MDIGGQRLDRFVAERAPRLSRAQVQRLIGQGHITVNGAPAKASRSLRKGDVISVTVPPPAPAELQPEANPLSIVYEDADLLVVDKPAGMTVHPAPGQQEHTLVNALLAHCRDLSGIGGQQRPGIVHRLDKDTSGLIIVAKHDRAHRGLADQLASRAIEKTYVALVKGNVSPDAGVIDAPIARDPGHRHRMAVVQGGRPAVTRYRVRRRYLGYTLVEAYPETGRTHQIRVHFASVGHPVAGDATYGGKVPFMARQFLHAAALTFHHPVTGALMELTSPLPQDLEAALRGLPS